MFSTLKNTLFILGALSLVTPLITVAKHPAHQSDNTKFKVVGGFNVINPATISPLNNGLRSNRYGTTTLLKQSSTPNGAPTALPDPLTEKDIVIRDQHYSLYDFSKKPLSEWTSTLDERPYLGYGIRYLPAVRGFKSEDAVNVGRGVSIRGSETVDAYLRESVFGFKPETQNTPPQDRPLKGDNNDADTPAVGAADIKNQPIFALINYVHPEGFQGEPFSLAGEPNLKTEMGFTHMGLYLGDGKTVNSPARYHADTWWDAEQANYPVFLSVMDYSGLVKDNVFNVKAFNQNGIMTALVLNETNGGPKFPDEYSYKFDPVYANTLEKALTFYARVLRNDPTLKTDNELKEYCAEHATQIINVLLNLPQNLTGYTDVYGEVEGPKLFEAAMDKIYNNEIYPLRSGDQAEWIRDAYLGSEEEYRRQSQGLSLVPYWKKLGGVAPLLQSSRNALGNVTFTARDPKFKEVGYSLGWAPETVADLLKDFSQAYLPWNRVGSITSVAAILGFAPEAQTRMNLKVLKYVTAITPIIQQIFLHEAAMEKGFDVLKSLSEEQSFEKFKAKRERRVLELQGTMKAMVARMQSAEFEEAARIDGKVASDITRISNTFMDLIKGSGVNAQSDSGWQNVSRKTQESLVGHSPTQDVTKLVAYRESLYDREYFPTVSPLLADLNKIEPEAGDSLTVKYYFAPAVSVRVAMGIHDAQSPARKDIRVWPVGHVIQANETQPLETNNSEKINDALSIDQDVFL